MHMGIYEMIIFMRYFCDLISKWIWNGKVDARNEFSDLNLAEPFTKTRPKTNLATTASTGTSNVSSSCAHRTMHHCMHFPISTANTHIGGRCACSGGQKSFSSRFGKGFRPIRSSFGQPPKPNHTTLSPCRHCDGEVFIHSTNGPTHLVLITRLLSLSKIRGLLRAFYTMRNMY